MRQTVVLLQIRILLRLRQQQRWKAAISSCCCAMRGGSSGVGQRRRLTTDRDSHPAANGRSMTLMFQQQLRELQQEQNQFSQYSSSTEDGNTTGDAVVSTSAAVAQQQQDAGGEQQHQLFREQMEQLRAEREDLFGFTHEEHSAWSNYGQQQEQQQKTSVDWMQALNEARQQQQDNDQSNRKIYTLDDEPIEGSEASLLLQPPRISNSSSTSSSSFTHVSPDGTSVHMVDVGEKQVTRRVAVAQSKVSFPPIVMQAIQVSNDLIGPKGPILATAKLAGIMAAKRTSELIPLCHPLPLEQVNVDIRLEGSAAIITCECRVTHKTGVEMEALMGASIAALTIYDMVKAMSHQVCIEETRLISKTGGKRTDYVDSSS